MAALSGRVAVVTGASRGIGKGVALALAEQGATVYVTGRTVTPGEYPLPGTIAETAAECDRRGGRGVAVQVDHAQDEQVAALFDRVAAEGRLDILVNNAFALPEDLTDPEPFWEKPLSDWGMVDVGVRSNFVAAWHAARLMAPRRSGLVVAISGYTGVSYTYGVIVGTAKSAVDRMARDMAIELKPHGVASLGAVAGPHLHRTAPSATWPMFPAWTGRRGDPAGERLLSRVPRAGYRRAGHRPGLAGPHRRHLHHRRARRRAAPSRTSTARSVPSLRDSAAHADLVTGLERWKGHP